MVKISLSRLDMETKRLERPHFKNYTETYVSVTATATTTLDVSLGNVFDLSQATSITTLNITNIPVSGTVCNITIIRTHDTSYNPYTISWPAAFKWPGGTAPTLTQFLDSVDIINAVTKDGGTTWYAFSGGLNTYDSSLFDPYFKNTVLLLKAPGANGKQNNNASTDFVDSSTNNFTVTRVGGAPGMTQGTFSPFSQTGWSGYFDGTGDFITVPDGASLELGTSDFTIEAWVYPQAITGADEKNRIYGNASADAQFGSVELFLGATGYPRAMSTADQTGWPVNMTSSIIAPLNSWSHIALTRSGSTWTLWVNGVSGATASSGHSCWDSVQPRAIGANVNGSNAFTGYISNVRVVKGTAVYTTAFTVPTSPLTAIANTQLLCLQDNRFKDNSTNNFVISVGGNTSIQTFSPFAPTKAYSTSLIGGSAYFDGTGDYLTVADNANLELGSGDFTIECWVYITTVGSETIMSKANSGNNSWGLILSNPSGVPQMWASSTGATFDIVNSVGTGSALSANSWHHLAFTRSGSTFTIWVNGVASGTATSSATLYNGTAPVSVGAYGDGTSPCYGYISNARIIKGTCLYTTTFTPSTAPLTAITNTQLLLNFTNSGIADYSSGNDIETFGNAQASTTVAKFSKSMYFDGTGDYLMAGNVPNLVLGTGNFTIEFWIYRTAVGVAQGIVDFRPGAGGAYPFIYMETTNVVKYHVSSADQITGTTTISASTWYHIAICRSGTSTKLFVNGVQDGATYTDATAYLGGANRPIIGISGYAYGNWPFTGYIEDLRITKGFARYPFNFTPPTATFTNQ